MKNVKNRLPSLMQINDELAIKIYRYVMGGIIVVLIGISFPTERFDTNVGLVFLTKALMSEETRENQKLLAQAEAQFIQAANKLPEKNTIWWWLSITFALQNRIIEAQQSGQMVDDIAERLILYGHQARKHRRFEDAIFFFDLIEKIAPAYNHISDAYSAQGMVYQWSLSDFENARAMYNKSLEVDKFSSDVMKAETFYRRGEVYRWRGWSVDHALQDYQIAVALNPDHCQAHLGLGYMFYKAYQDVQLAELELDKANTLCSTRSARKLMYLIQGNIYRNAQLITKAINAYEELLKIDKHDRKVREMLEALRREIENQ